MYFRANLELPRENHPATDTKPNQILQKVIKKTRTTSTIAPRLLITLDLVLRVLLNVLACCCIQQLFLRLTAITNQLNHRLHHQVHTFLDQVMCIFRIESYLVDHNVQMLWKVIHSSTFHQCATTLIFFLYTI
jgi:hypothetical protein